MPHLGKHCAPVIRWPCSSGIGRPSFSHSFHLSLFLRLFLFFSSIGNMTNECRVEEKDGKVISPLSQKSGARGNVK